MVLVRDYSSDAENWKNSKEIPSKDCNVNRKFFLSPMLLLLINFFLVDVQAMHKDMSANDESDVLLLFC